MDKRFLIFMAKGLLTRVPLSERLRKSRAHTGGSDSADYCLRVWMRHLTALVSEGGLTQMPRTLVEYGPGDSIGVGLAFLLLGGERYEAVDYVPFANTQRNLRIMGKLVELLRSDTLLFEYSLSESILNPEILDRSLDQDRVADIGESLRNNDGRYVRYTLSSLGKLGGGGDEEPVDVIVSQAVMEHVDNVRAVCNAAYSVLKPGGLMSHQIDHRAHGMSDWWNGHWQCSDASWRFAVGRRPYAINRLPSSAYLTFMKAAGFEIVKVERRIDGTGLPASRFASQFQDMDPTDAQTSGTYVLARKPWTLLESDRQSDVSI